MRNKQIFYTILLIGWSCCGFTFLSVSGLAQSFENENRRTENFGASLSKIAGRKTDKPKKDKTESKPQTIADAPDDEIIRVETTLIVNDVQVSDKQGNPVKNLKKEDFIVKEDDELQEIEVFSRGDGETIPRSIVLLIDYSGSQLPYIETSVEAAKVLVDQLNPTDRMAIVTDNVELVQDFTGDKTLLKAKLETLKKNALSGTLGRSRQYSALMAVLNEMFDPTILRPIIIFQTDGDELFHLKKTVNDQQRGNVEFSFEDVLTATEKTRATIYTIIPGPSFIAITKDEQLKRAKTCFENNIKAFNEMRNIVFEPDKIKVSEKSLKLYAEFYRRQQWAIAEIAKFTGGKTDYLEQPEQADKVYSAILSEINLRYIIGYYPTNQARNGKKREVKTEVRGHPEYSIWGRRAYIPAEAKK